MLKYIILFIFITFLSINAYAASTIGTISVSIIDPNTIATISNDGTITGLSPLYCDIDLNRNMTCYY